MSDLGAQLRTVIRQHNRPDTCAYRGKVTRREKKTCCGTVEIFDCAKLKHEVWDSKCLTCEHYTTTNEADPEYHGCALLLSWGVPERLASMATALEGNGLKTHTIERGKKLTAKHAREYIRDHRPRFCVWWQRPYGEAAQQIMAACRRWSVRPIVTDHGCRPHYNSVIFDPRGENAGADIVGRFDRLSEREEEYIVAQMPVIDEWRDDMVRDAVRVNDRRADLGLRNIPDRFALVTLQRRDKVLDLDAPKHVQKHVELARQLIEAAESQKMFVAIKPHPQGKALDIPQRGPYHCVIQQRKHGLENTRVLAWLLLHCSHLITVNSTTWMTAAVVGTPVVVLGDGWYSGNNVLKRAKSVADALNPPAFDYARARRFVAFLLSRQLHKDVLDDPGRFKGIVDRFYPGWLDGSARRDRRKVCIVGCGRSGTKYTAELLHGCGLKVGHERIGEDGACGWTLACDRPYQNHLGYAPNRSDFVFDVMLHQVRHPVDAIASLTTHEDRLWDAVHAELGVPGMADKVKRALRFWVLWNQRCEAMADWTYRVEDLKPETETWTRIRDLLGLTCECPELPKNVNSRKHRALNARDLIKRYPAWGRRMAKMAERYGYEL